MEAALSYGKETPSVFEFTKCEFFEQTSEYFKVYQHYKSFIKYKIVQYVFSYRVSEKTILEQFLFNANKRSKLPSTFTWLFLSYSLTARFDPRLFVFCSNKSNIWRSPGVN